MSFSTPESADRQQLRSLLGEYRDSGRSMRAEQAQALHKRRLLSLAKLAASIIQRLYRAWIHKKRQLARMKAHSSITRELGTTFEDTFSVVLRNVNNSAALQDDSRRRIRQKQQRKAYLMNVLKLATAAGSLRQLVDSTSFSLTARDGGAKPAVSARTAEKAPGIMRAALQLQLQHQKRTTQAEVAAVNSPRAGADSVHESPGQVLFEILAKVSHSSPGFSKCIF
jgi:hypothetical protein